MGDPFEQDVNDLAALVDNLDKTGGWTPELKDRVARTSAALRARRNPTPHPKGLVGAGPEDIEEARRLRNVSLTRPTAPEYTPHSALPPGGAESGAGYVERSPVRAAQTKEIADAQQRIRRLTGEDDPGQNKLATALFNERTARLREESGRRAEGEAAPQSEIVLTSPLRAGEALYRGADYLASGVLGGIRGSLRPDVGEQAMEPAMAESRDIWRALSMNEAPRENSRFFGASEGSMMAPLTPELTPEEQLMGEDPGMRLARGTASGVSTALGLATMASPAEPTNAFIDAAIPAVTGAPAAVGRWYVKRKTSRVLDLLSKEGAPRIGEAYDALEQGRAARGQFVDGLERTPADWNPPVRSPVDEFRDRVLMHDAPGQAKLHDLARAQRGGQEMAAADMDARFTNDLSKLDAMDEQDALAEISAMRAARAREQALHGQAGGVSELIQARDAAARRATEGAVEREAVAVGVGIGVIPVDSTIDALLWPYRSY